MSTRKFTYVDVSDWKVVGVDGEEKSITKFDKNGNKRIVSRFDGYRSASQVARQLGGTAVRV